MDALRIPARRPAARRLLLALLVFAMGVLPALGLVHGVVHAGKLHLPTAAQGAFAPHGADSAQGQLLAGFFGDHQDGAQCVVFDGLTHAAPPAAAPPVLPLLLPTACFAFLQGEFVARRAALFDARGPPASR